MDNPLNSIVQSLVKENGGALMEAVLDKVPELRDLLQGKPVDLTITLQLKPKPPA